ncbi:MAG: hypothetical protein J6C81_01415 [Muribaculaceae bacterium]|nr:hypothetical protein [Muribaculaceae bacterium]
MNKEKTVALKASEKKSAMPKNGVELHKEGRGHLESSSDGNVAKSEKSSPKSDQQEEKKRKEPATDGSEPKTPVVTANPDGDLEVNEEEAYRQICDEIAEVLSEKFVSALEERWAAIRQSSSLEEALASLEAAKQNAKEKQQSASISDKQVSSDNGDASQEEAVREAYIRGKNEAIEERWEGFKEDDKTAAKQEKIERIFRRRASVWDA